MNLTRTVSMLAAVGMFVFAPTSAMGWEVEQGPGDRTATINSEYGFKACDGEYDGRPMRGKAADGRGAVESETDGGDAGCDRRPNPPDIGEIDYLQTCEIINNYPDACTDWYNESGTHHDDLEDFPGV